MTQRRGSRGFEPLSAARSAADMIIHKLLLNLGILIVGNHL